jgi:hypothetical protein
MTIWDALWSVTRKWYVALLAVVAGLVASYVAMGDTGVYWSRAEVTFLAPTSEINPNALRTTSSDLVVTAAVVARRVNGNLVWNKMADPAATIVGEGVRHGWAVRLPDYGGQWSRVYPRQVLDVQVAGPSVLEVTEQQQRLIERIDAELAEMQAGVSASDRVTTAVVPAVPNVYHYTGDKKRALMMIWILAAGAWLAATVLTEPLSERRPWRGAVDTVTSPRHSRRATVGRRAATGQT